MGVVFAVLATFAAQSRAATITVTSNGDDTTTGDSTVSLREAINSINAASDSGSDVTANRTGTYGVNDMIVFDIPGTGVQTIAPTSALPATTKPVTIDGTTQPGTGPVRVFLSGTGTGVAASGLSLEAKTTVKGLAIGNFSGSGIDLTSLCIFGFCYLTSDQSTIQGDDIGTDATGNVAAPDGTGISDTTNSVTILDNVISGNSGAGIALTGSSSVVEGNLVGTNAAGSAALPNSATSGAISVGGVDNVVGGTAAPDRNVISGNAGNGILVSTASAAVQGNYIGTDVTGSRAIPNAGDGIHLTVAGTQIISGQPSAPQRIWFNTGFGIRNEMDTTRFTANSIHANHAGGIAVGGSPATGSLSISPDRKTVTVKYSNGSPGGLMEAEVFDNPGQKACPGQGQVFEGGATVGSSSAGKGTATVVLASPLNPGDGVTATLTDNTKGTSPFVCLAGGVPVPNSFTFSLKALSKGKIRVKINSPAAGTYNVKATTKVNGTKITYGTRTTSIGHAGKKQIKIKPSTAAKDALNAGATLKVSVTVTFHPAGGTPKTEHKSVTVHP